MEEKLKKRIEKTKATMDSLDEYNFKEETIGNVYANFVSLLISCPLVFILYCCYTWKNGSYEINSTFTVIFLLIITIIGIFVHEALHGLTMLIMTKKKENIEFGVNTDSIPTPYCTCQSAMKWWQYLITLMTPTIILGFGIGVISVITDSSILFIFAISMIIGGGGDMLMTIRIIRKRPDIVIDHPLKCGFYGGKKRKRNVP